MQEWIDDNAKSKILEGENLVEQGRPIASVPGITSPAPHIIEDDIVRQISTARTDFSSREQCQPRLIWKV